MLFIDALGWKNTPALKKHFTYIFHSQDHGHLSLRMSLSPPERNLGFLQALTQCKYPYQRKALERRVKCLLKKCIEYSLFTNNAIVLQFHIVGQFFCVCNGLTKQRALNFPKAQIRRSAICQLLIHPNKYFTALLKLRHLSTVCAGQRAIINIINNNIILHLLAVRWNS